MQRHRVVVIGAGFGGLFAIKALRTAPVDITLINGTAYHLFQPLLYQVATGILSEGEIAPPIREVLRRQGNVDVRLGWVTGVDADARTVSVSAPGLDYTVEYDTLIVSAGASQSYFGHEEYADHAPGMKSIDDALELRARIFGAFLLVGRHLGHLELSEDAVAQVPGVFDRFHAGGELGEVVVPEVGVSGARGHHERVVRELQRPVVRTFGPHDPALDVDVGDLGEQGAHVRIAPNGAAQRGGDQAGRQDARRHLVEEGLEEVVVGAVDERDVDIRAVEPVDRVQPSEPAAHDDDPMAVGHCCLLGW